MLDDASAMGGNLWINQNTQMFLQSDVRALLVEPCQTAITGDISREYSR